MQLIVCPCSLPAKLEIVPCLSSGPIWQGPLYWKRETNVSSCIHASLDPSSCENYAGPGGVCDKVGRENRPSRAIAVDSAIPGSKQVWLLRVGSCRRFRLTCAAAAVCDASLPPPQRQQQVKRHVNASPRPGSRPLSPVGARFLLCS